MKYIRKSNEKGTEKELKIRLKGCFRVLSVLYSLIATVAGCNRRVPGKMLFYSRKSHNTTENKQKRTEKPRNVE